MIKIQTQKATKYQIIKVTLKMIKAKQIHSEKSQVETKAKNNTKVLNIMKKNLNKKIKVRI